MTFAIGPTTAATSAALSPSAAMLPMFLTIDEAAVASRPRRLRAARAGEDDRKNAEHLGRCRRSCGGVQHRATGATDPRSEARTGCADRSGVFMAGALSHVQLLSDGDASDRRSR